MAEFPAKVLVVDDDVAFGGMIAEVLTGRGFVVERFDDPREAVARARVGDFAVAVVDLKMPHLTGLEVVQQLQATAPETQVIILTGQGDMTSAIAGIAHGVFAYLQKDEVRIDLVEHTVAGAADKAALRRRSRELMERLQDSNRLLRALQASSTSIAAETHLDVLLRKVVDTARQATRATTARALLFDVGPDGDLLISGGEGDDADTLRGVRLGAEEGIVVLAAQKEQTISVEDPKAHPRYSHRCDTIRARPRLRLCAPAARQRARSPRGGGERAGRFHRGRAGGPGRPGPPGRGGDRQRPWSTSGRTTSSPTPRTSSSPSSKTGTSTTPASPGRSPRFRT